MGLQENGNDLPIEVRIKAKKEAAVAAVGGPEAIQQKLYDLAVPRLVESRDERGKAILRAELMAEIHPTVPTPEKWADEADPKEAKGVYKALDALNWRYLDMDPNGAIQKQLNEDLGLVLCRTKNTPSGQWGVYVTRDRKCIESDYLGPMRTQVQISALRDAARADLAIRRVPEHARAFRSGSVSALGSARRNSLAILDTAVEEALSLEAENDE